MPHGLMPALLATGYRVNDRHFTRRQVQLIFEYLGAIKSIENYGSAMYALFPLHSSLLTIKSEPSDFSNGRL